MAHILATNITSPLGWTTDENYRAVKAGRSVLRRYEGLWGLPDAFTASLFTEEQRRDMAIDGLTRFEALAVRSVSQALDQLPDIDLTGRNVAFILSTTKANIEDSQSEPGEAARHIVRHLGFTADPIVVCNACISGVAALILAQRLLDGGQYEYAVVCGADVLNPFVVSGFQSLKALSERDCRPFDMERTGLNLGEAAATIVLSCHEREDHSSSTSDYRPQTLDLRAISIEKGVIRNDAFHISSPSKNGEGAWLALSSILPSPLNDLAFINAHGTATMFNDQMESVAIERAGLNNIPVNGLKGYYGHTLGAAGVLETVISLAALCDRTVLATRGFEERGVSGRISVTTHHSPTDKTAFLKMISGFGGGNAALVVAKEGSETSRTRETERTKRAMEPTHRVVLTPTSVNIDGKPVEEDVTLTSLYKRFVGDYPKYYKMDGLSRLGFIASELLLQAEAPPSAPEGATIDSPLNGKTIVAPSGAEGGASSRAIVLFNSSTSVVADQKFLETIAVDNFFPSPSVFVYTLPNIVTGEIAMRNGYHGETSFYILPHRNEELMQQIINATFQDSNLKSMVTGWLDYYSEDDYVADLMLLS